ncbi:MAG: hypothetical protein ABEJ04_07075 [Halobacteriaceae archaeon]
MAVDAGDGGEGIEAALRRARYAPDRADFDRLLALLDDPDVEPEVRRRVLRALASVPVEYAAALSSAVPALADRLDDERTRRQYAVRALARVAAADPDAVRPAVDGLVDCLDDRNHWVRSGAAEALGTAFAADPAGVEATFDRLDRATPEVRGTVVDLLASVAAVHPVAVAPAAPRLRELFVDRRHRRGRVLAALEPLAAHDPSLAVPVAPTLRTVLAESDDPETRRRALSTLAAVARVAPDAVDPAVAHVGAALRDDDESVRRAAVDVLLELLPQRPASTETVARLVRQAGYWERVRATRLLADEFADAVLADPLFVSLLGAEGWYVRRPVLRALAARHDEYGSPCERF